jgi:hypothetical protein
VNGAVGNLLLCTGGMTATSVLRLSPVLGLKICAKDLLCSILYVLNSSPAASFDVLLCVVSNTDKSWCAPAQGTDFYKQMKVAEGIERGYVTVLSSVEEALDKCSVAGVNFRVCEWL